jgi:hypothetical protein
VLVLLDVVDAIRIPIGVPLGGLGAVIHLSFPSSLKSALAPALIFEIFGYPDAFESTPHAHLA